MTPDFTPEEARRAFAALGAEMGERRLYVSLNAENWSRARPALHASIYNTGSSAALLFSVDADTFRALVESVREKWLETKEAHEAALVRRMALAIIDLTAAQGECTDAALRQHFDAGDVARLGERAAAEANEIAAGGPFVIVALGGSNAEAA